MRSIRLPDDVDAREAAAVRGGPGSLDDADETIDEPCRVFWPDGSLAAEYGTVDDGTVDETFRVTIPRVSPASGIRSGGLPTRSRQFGAHPRYPIRRQEYCGRAVMEREYPAEYARLVALGGALGDRYAAAVPMIAGEQTAWVETEVLPEYRMVGPFTSGILNFENPLPYHRDSGNVRGSWNAMVVVREHVTGGELVLPAWRLAFACADRSVLLLDTGRTLHGVAPMVRRRVGGYRTSIVYYCLRQLANCLCPEAEMERARRMRTLREDRRAGLAE